MSNYTKSTNFATKDTLTSGDPLKIVKGTEINTEFDNISTAIATKADTASPTFTGTVTIPTLSVSGLTASKPVFTDSSKGLVSTGTLGADQGGTGVANNAAMTVTGSGNFAYTRTLTGTTNVTFPTTGTLATLAGTETFTNKTLGAGTASVPSIKLTSGTNLTTATVGAVEYDGKVIYATPIGTQRGIVPTQQYYRLNSTVAGAQVTTAQSIFGVGVTLSASTVYEFEMVAALSKSAGTTSHSFGYGFGGTATLNNIGFLVTGASQSSSFAPLAAGANVIEMWIVGAGNTNVNNGITSAAFYNYVVVKGTVSVNAGGTFIPQYTLSADPGGAYTTQIGSFIRIAPVSASGANTSVGAWS
jgi:hypothetical protein